MSLPPAIHAAVAAAVATPRVPPGPILSYGTAGFRAHASLLDDVFVRCGMLAALRSASGSAVRVRRGRGEVRVTPCALHPSPVPPPPRCAVSS